MKRWITIFLIIIIICLLLIIFYLLSERQNENIITTEGMQEKINLRTINETIVNNETNLEEENNNMDKEKTDKEEKEEEAEIERLSGISKKEAIGIALENANVQNDNLIFLTSYITKYNGDFAYHIKFKTNDNYTMYDYVINAITGKIELTEKH